MMNVNSRNIITMIGAFPILEKSITIQGARQSVLLTVVLTVNSKTVLCLAADTQRMPDASSEMNRISASGHCHLGLYKGMVTTVKRAKIWNRIQFIEQVA